MSSTKLDVLISGGGIAGPCLAWWLRRRVNANITIIERAPEPRTSGQAVDIRDAGVHVIQQMGLEETIKSKGTTEVGMEFIYADGKTKASFPMSGDTNNQSLTSEFEILRGDLAQIFYDITKGDVTYVYDEYLSSVQEQENGKVKVAFANHFPETEFDLIVGADGMISKTRRIVWGKGPDEEDFLKRLGQYCAFFTIPRVESDTKWAQTFLAGKGRMVATRPDRYGETRCYLAVTDPNLSRFETIEKSLREGQDAHWKWLEEEFEGAGWQTERVLEGMKNSKDFYMQQIAQVKMEEFVKGRVALLGDAGYCPSPISGMGTSSAIVGAYVLAGELAKSPNDIDHALKQYQSVMRPFVDGVQSLPPGAPQIVNPQSPTALAIINKVIGFASNYWVQKVFSLSMSILPNKKWSPPSYPTLEL